MLRRNLTELADNPDYISGIYNYCDRWCERCPLTSRCLVYATEQEDEDHSLESHNLNNEAFWRKLVTISQETQELIAAWATEAGVDLNAIPGEEDERARKRRSRVVENHPLARAGKNYANAVSDWFREFDQTMETIDERTSESENEQAEQFADAREVIQWYQYQIAVKTIRALSGRNDGFESLPEMAGVPKDSDGSAKVALIGIERSIAAWRLVQLSLSDRADSTVPLMLQLEQLRKRIEVNFPEARSFVRPGFDEVLE